MNQFRRIFNVIDHPMRVGLIWAILTFLVMIVWAAFVGEPVWSIEHAVIAIALLPAGLAWGYLMKWYLGWFMRRRIRRAR